jgi:hypothetical protein
VLSPGVPKSLAFERLFLGPGKRLVPRADGDGVPDGDMPGVRGGLPTGPQRLHERAGSDLPWHGVAVSILVRACRFFCDRASCERRIFCERLPDVSARARKTNRLEETLLAIALKLGGRAGARLASELGLLVGRDALLSRPKNVAPVAVEDMRILGIDDFAFKKATPTEPCP